jgi:pilus assembly protein TadC
MSQELSLVSYISIGFIIGCVLGYFFIPPQTMLGGDAVALGGIIGIIPGILFYFFINRKK